jgi:ElaB/YqjD/DUF883 family membrane-anchored ribosome-binding protein
MNRTTTPVEDKVAATATELQKSAEAITRPLADAAAQEAARVGDMVRDWVDRQSEHARNTAAAVRDEAYAAKARTERYVSDEPLKSVLIAAAAGALITGLVMFATRSRHR